MDKALRLYERGGLFDVGGTENHHAFAFIEKRIEIGNADASFGKTGDGIGSAAGLVIEYDGKHFRFGDGKTLLGKHGISLFRIIAKDAAYAIVGRIGQSRGNKLDALFSKNTDICCTVIT